MTEESVIIQHRFHGPPNSGNGGYVCGLLGRQFDGPADVTLRRPPPLDRPLALVSGSDGRRLLDGDEIIAEGVAKPLDLEVVAIPDMEAAIAASRNYTGFDRHIFPTCFVCGPARQPGDGLCIFPGRIPGSETVAARWVPDESLVDPGTGLVDPVYLWAALDCPGYFAVSAGAAVLGRLNADIRRCPNAGEPLIVIGWPLGREGRKYFAGTAVVNEDGAVIGRARATWIQVSPDDFGAA